MSCLALFSGCLSFSVLPAGNCNGSSFYNAGNNANFWSATSNSGNNAYNRNLNYSNAGVNRNNNNKNNGFSVRCVRDRKIRKQCIAIMGAQAPIF